MREFVKRLERLVLERGLLEGLGFRVYIGFRFRDQG